MSQLKVTLNWKSISIGLAKKFIQGFPKMLQKNPNELLANLVTSLDWNPMSENY